MAGVIDPRPNNKSVEQCGGKDKDGIAKIRDKNPSKSCADLSKIIEDLVNRKTKSKDGIKGLKLRFKQQIEGDPPWETFDLFKRDQRFLPGGSNSWMRHDADIKQQQTNLFNLLKEYENNGCGGGDGTSIPDDALEWATKPPPSEEEWTGKSSNIDFGIEEGAKYIAEGLLMIGVIVISGAMFIMTGGGIATMPRGLGTVNMPMPGQEPDMI